MAMTETVVTRKARHWVNLVEQLNNIRGMFDKSSLLDDVTDVTQEIKQLTVGFKADLLAVDVMNKFFQNMVQLSDTV